MRRLAWICIAASGCTGWVSGSSLSLRVEPAAIDLTVDLASAAPAVSVQVFVDGPTGTDDVTAEASFTLAGTRLGVIDGATFTSDGATGGLATVQVAYDELTATVPVSANVREVRIVDGTPAGAASAFDAATRTAIDAHLDPADGAVLPPGLGALEISFTADDLDDAHQVHVTAPYLDLDVVAPGVAGPRMIQLTPSELAAIGHTARGGAVELDVASLASSAPAAAQVATSNLEIADLDPNAILAGGFVDATQPPSLWRYDAHAGTVAPIFASPDGACIGCHLGTSADGSRIAALSFVAGSTTPPNGVILDAHTGAVLAQSDPASASPWFTSTFDPGGALVSAWQGALSLRDGSTGALVAAVATGEAASAPTISPDGTALAYVTLDAGPGVDASQPIGDALHVRPWNAAQASVGAPIELVRDGAGVVLPAFSSDGRWIAFGHSTTASEKPLSSAAVRADGSGTTVMLTSDPLDQLAHWASPIAPASAGGRAPEPMVWIALVSERAVGGNATSPRQLWLEAFFPDRGVVAPAFHLPGQPAALQILHGPIALAGN